MSLFSEFLSKNIYFNQIIALTVKNSNRRLNK